MNLKEAFFLAKKKLCEHRCPGSDPERESTELLSIVINKPKEFLLSSPEQILTSDQEKQLLNYLNRRLNHEPIERIIEYSTFCGLNFKISSETLIPRPATEILVQSILNEFQENGLSELIVDVGTGSGCIAIALASLLEKKISILATDISAESIKIAKDNAYRNQVNKTIEFFNGDLLEPTLNNLKKTKNFTIVANLPYIPTHQKNNLAPDVYNFDPPTALYGGPDGLVYIKQLFNQLAEFLNEKSANKKISLFIEHLPEQFSALDQELKTKFKHVLVEAIQTGDSPSSVTIGLKAKITKNDM